MIFRHFLVGTAFGILLFILVVMFISVTGHNPKIDITIFLAIGFLAGVIADVGVGIQAEIRRSNADQ